MTNFLLIFLLYLFASFFPNNVSASESKSLVTVVTPVRSRFFWQNENALNDQVKLITGKNIPSTWLIQYSLLFDKLSLNILHNLPKDQEIGVFLEVDENLANDAFTPYLYGEGDWARPDKVLLSGYLPNERIRMINIIFNKFKNEFGYYPKSVGAWYIDTDSLDYMVDRYGIKSVLDCSDQYTTDKYGLWGKPWGVPYFPSRLNSLLPARSKRDNLDIVKIQWAPRDPLRGYGLGVPESTYSVQANDYIGHHGLNIDYFKKLAEIYLFSNNKINQLTVGLETGQESVKFFDELSNQLDYLNILSQDNKIEFKTMSDFSVRFKEIFAPENYEMTIKGDSNSTWYSSSYYRAGIVYDVGKLKIRDLRDYSKDFVFSDIYSSDKNKVLKRFLPACVDELNNKNEIAFSELDDLNFYPDRIILNQKEIFKKRSSLEYLRSGLIKWIIDYYIDQKSNSGKGFRYTNLYGTHYYGFAISPQKFIGVKSHLPFLAIGDFPFQVLVRFKTLPVFDPVKQIARYLVDNSYHCTIE